MEFDILSEEQKIIVRRHYEVCMNDKTQKCSEEHGDIIEFWEAHKEADFEDFLDGRYVDFKIHNPITAEEFKIFCSSKWVDKFKVVSK